MQSQSQLPKVSTRLEFVWLDSRLGIVFSENESLDSASKTKSLGSVSFTSLVNTHRILTIHRVPSLAASFVTQTRYNRYTQSGYKYMRPLSTTYEC